MSTRHKDGLAKLAELVEGIDVAMLTTATQDGRLLSRPLRAQTVDVAEGTLWFVTDRDSQKVDAVQTDPHVNVAFAAPGDNTWVSVSGRAQVLFDKAMLQRLWNPAMAVFYPRGVDDPGLCLLRVQIDSAEYWDSPGGLIGTALYLATAALTGDAGALSENERLSFRH